MSDAFSIVEEVVASDGIRLAVHRFPAPAGSLRGTIVSLHGIQSHAGWYRRSSRLLAEAGWEVWFLDRRGSGLSAGERGHAPHWERLVNDVVQVLKMIRWVGADGPVVLQAVSWGGRLAATVAARRPELVDGLALLYPGIATRIGPTVWERALLRLADWVGVRHRRVPIPLNDSRLFTSDPAWQHFIENDDLAVRDATTGFLIADRALNSLAWYAAEEIRCPTLLMLAGRDRIIDNGAMRRWFENLRMPAKTLVEFPDAGHTLEFEPCFEEYVGRLLAWLETMPGVHPSAGSKV
jgi:acylglycerol lipase